VPPARAPRYELVIFDCDGVLVDSEPIANRVLARALTELGRPTTADEAWRDYGGQTWDACFAQMERSLGRALPQGFPQLFAARLEQALERELEPIPGIHEALAAISTPNCVASNGRHETMRLTLAKTGLLARFEGRIFSAADVSRPKPFPDLYLHAAARMGTPPERCAVVEDSPRGAAAGVAAGMTVFGFAAQGEAARLAPSCAHVFADMRALPSLLGES
jgi:HAD superfamily hydrolase (TIGR01509 family)